MRESDAGMRLEGKGFRRERGKNEKEIVSGKEEGKKRLMGKEEREEEENQEGCKKKDEKVRGLRGGKDGRSSGKQKVISRHLSRLPEHSPRQTIQKEQIKQGPVSAIISYSRQLALLKDCCLVRLRKEKRGDSVAGEGGMRTESKKKRKRGTQEGKEGRCEGRKREGGARMSQCISDVEGSKEEN